MELTAIEAQASEDPTSAEATIQRLVEAGDIEELSGLAASGRVAGLQARAIEALGEIGGGEATARLVGLLERANAAAVEGGTEQRLDQERLRAELVRSLSRARGVGAPDPRDRRAVAEFVEACRGR